MKIRQPILDQLWKQAAVEEIATTYRDNGYIVEKAAKIANMETDLIARKDQEVIFFEFKSIPWDKTQAQHVDQLRHYVLQHHLGQFKLVLVNRPTDRLIEIEGLEQILYETGLQQMPCLKELPHSQLEKISAIDIFHSVIRQPAVELKGLAVAHYLVDTPDSKQNGHPGYEESFPLTFHISLGHDFNLKQVYEFKVDCSGG